jgi:hypothetical protein
VPDRHHCAIEAFGIPAETFECCRSVIKKTLMDNLGEWSGLKLYETSAAKKVYRAFYIQIESVIPKEFGFLHVSQGLDDGFVHVIDSEGAGEVQNAEERMENSLMHSKVLHERFGRELVASILKSESWRNQYPSLMEIQKIKRQFSEFDWVSLLDE